MLKIKRHYSSTIAHMIMKKNVWILLIFILNLSALAQQAPNISASEKDEVIEKVTKLLNKNYVFPNKAREMGAYLQKQNKNKTYQDINNYRSFAEALARDLQKANRDLHMGLQYDPQQIEMIRQWEASSKQSPEMQQEQLRMAVRENFGFVKVERLPGNIGYIDFRQFFPVSEEARQTVASAMGFIANTDAVILDMRHNGGGHPEMVQLVISYFFKEKPIHYNSLYDRPNNTTKDYYTLSKIEGRRMPDVDLYVLTSGYTFSAAEELTYNLQTQKRATIVGEITGGGAHPTNPFVINDYLILNVPVARAINAVTKTNWEGTGIMPDVPAEAKSAFLQARYLALKKLVAAKSDLREKTELDWELLAVTGELYPIRLKKETQEAYAGRYGEKHINFLGNELYYQPKNGPKKKIIPITEDTFRFQDLDYFRIKIVKDESGNAEKLLELYKDGRIEESARTN